MMNDFSKDPLALRIEVNKAMKRVVSSGHYILGPEVESFEREWSDWTGIDHAVGVANGLDAIVLGLEALGIGPGDEVITTSMTAFATVLGIYKTGAVPVIVDIDPKDALMSIQSAREGLSNRTKAVLLVHLYGRMPDMDNWVQFARENNIFLVEDCAQAHGSSYKGQKAGSFGVFGAYSFYPTKNLGGLGDGGAVVTRDADLAAKTRRLRNYGQVDRYNHADWGANSRLDEIQAAILRVRLRWLDRFVARRRTAAKMYADAFEGNDDFQTLSGPNSLGQHSYHLYVLRSSSRDRFISQLSAKKIQSLIHYPVAIHQQPVFPSWRVPAPEGLPHAEKHALECFSLPCHPGMSDSDVRYVAESVIEVSKMGIS